MSFDTLLEQRIDAGGRRKQVLHDLFVQYQDQIEIVLFETGSQMGWVADILWALNMPFEVANTNHAGCALKIQKDRTENRIEG